MPDVSESTSPPAPATPVVLASGAFRGIEHETSGSALIVELADGTRLLRFDELDTSNGPDLKVFLSTEPADGDASRFVDDALRLGELKGNVGSQNYELAAGEPLDRYRSAR